MFSLPSKLIEIFIFYSMNIFLILFQVHILNIERSPKVLTILPTFLQVSYAIVGISRYFHWLSFLILSICMFCVHAQTLKICLQFLFCPSYVPVLLVILTSSLILQDPFSYLALTVSFIAHNSVETYCCNNQYFLVVPEYSFSVLQV